MAARMWVFNASTNHWQPLSGGEAAGGDHGSLTGLEDDDHPQYHNDARGDARYALIAHRHDYPNDPQIYSDEIYLRPSNLRQGSNITIINNADGTVTISGTGGGSGDGVDEVSIGTGEPSAPGVELWIDTDASGTFRTIPEANAATDHGTLNGLGDDDHPQYVLRSGSTMTGGLTLTGAVGVKHGPTSGVAQITSESIDGEAYFDTRAPAAKGQGLVMRTGTQSRWMVGTDTIAESGSNGGTNLIVARFADNGSLLGTALSINRASGLVTVAADPTDALGVSTKGYTDGKVVNSATGTSTTSAPSQDAIKKYVDAKMIVSDSAASGTYPINTVWVEY